MDIKLIIGLIIFITSFYFIITEKIPGVWASLLGGVMMVIFGIITKEESIRAVSNNLHIILLLVAMMIIVNIISETGIFQWIALKIAIFVKIQPVKLLIVFGLVTGFLSAFLDNVTTVLLVIPIAIVLTKELELDSTPYIVLIMISSNIGGAATLIGDPPNLIVASEGSLSFNSFFVNAAPLAIINLILVVGAFGIFFRKKLVVPRDLRIRMMNIDTSSIIKDKKTLKKALIVFLLVIISFVLEGLFNKGLENIALTGAMYLAIRMKKEPNKLFKELEWEMIFFLIGLFILISGVEKLKLLGNFGEIIVRYSKGNAKPAALLVLWLSNISTIFLGSLSNVVTFAHIIENIHGIFPGKILWWALSYGSCYGGVGTAVASACNLVAIDVAKQGGRVISYKEYMKYGISTLIFTGIVNSIYIYFILQV